MQATTRAHDRIMNPAREEADLICHHTIAFHPTNRVSHAESDRRDPTIGGCFRRGEVTPAGVFLGGARVTTTRTTP
jgi:hypothetical protein